MSIRCLGFGKYLHPATFPGDAPSVRDCPGCEDCDPQPCARCGYGGFQYVTDTELACGRCGQWMSQAEPGH